jgi:8-oxo-dGTP pyrophosphatase MutT (NUDIX family)
MSWATCTLGHAHWGPRGAAGLLVADDGRVLLQLRARWAHQGGTWSIPGGARERGESSVEAALREAREELGVDPAGVETVGSYVAECGGWRYETVFARATVRLRLEDRAESAGHRWVAADQVGTMKLHPAFREAWTSAAELREWVDLTRG